jgi:flagellar basal-body rod protein FlgF
VNIAVQLAASGLKAQVEALDLLANNLANLNTNGFKEEKAFFTYLDESMGSPQDADPGRLRTVSAQGALNVRDGLLQPTQREFDIALVGNGFLAVETPQGERYTRNGSFRLNAKSELVTSGGYPVLGPKGRIAVTPGRLVITEQGGVYSDNTLLGQLKLVTFDEPAAMVQEGNSLLAPPSSQAKPKPADVQIKQGYLEQSNVNAVASMVEMVGLMRRFEAIQKSVGLVLNEVDSKSIDRLGH